MIIHCSLYVCVFEFVRMPAAKYTIPQSSTNSAVYLVSHNINNKLADINAITEPMKSKLNPESRQSRNTQARFLKARSSRT